MTIVMIIWNKSNFRPEYYQFSEFETVRVFLEELTAG